VSVPPAGWYPDPAGPNSQRWWDGVQWSQQTRPIVVAPPPPPPPPPSQPAAHPYAFHSQPGYSFVAAPVQEQVTGAASTRLMRTNTVGFVGALLALVSLLFNLFSLVSIAAVILCIIGLVADERKRNMGAPHGGRGWMIAGLVIGSLSSIWTVVNTIGVIHRLTGTG
jgi:hypothetical protein